VDPYGLYASFPFASMFPRSAAFIGFAAVLLAVPLLSAGCGNGGDGGGQSRGTPTMIMPLVVDASEGGISEEVSQGAGMAPTLKGNSLCQASESTCFPDDVFPVCDPPLADAGLAGLDERSSPTCRVVASGSDPSCFPAGLGLTNATCSQSNDCAAGHECIAAGSCQHYCCGGTPSCEINEFCDVQPTAQDPTVVVPVCMSEVPCLLFQDEFCPASQQCSVVREDGSTSCVNVGAAQDGDSCDAAHCARGLVCLGAQGAKQCAPLCYTALPNACTNTAKPGRKCIATLPLFHDKSIGVCQ
jgi:hypothetical protein